MTNLAEVTDEYCDALWERVNNWGRWGAEDQAGALNLIDDRKRREAALLVSEGDVLGMGNDWPVDPGPHNAWPAEHRMIRAGDDPDYPGVPGLSVALDYIGVQHHGVACSHIDALCHVFVNKKMYNGFPATEVKSTGALKNDLRPMFDGIVTRGVLLDMPRYFGEPFLDGDVRIGAADLEGAANSQGVQMSPGDVLIVHKGRQRRIETEGLFDPNVVGMPGLHPECAVWLRDNDVAVLGSDYMNDPQPNWACERWPIPIHYLGICGMGMTLLHNLDTESAARRCEQLGRWVFLLSIASLKVPGGTGSPVNPLAMF
ncbi:MAG: cyclase family protein [Pseudomonadales bacterium]|nr:cyclase family protein [Pseudomonadales bacterium]